MSKVLSKIFLRLVIISTLLVYWPIFTVGQEMVAARIVIDASRGVASVDGNFSSDHTKGPPNLSFRTSTLGVTNLVSRISKIKIMGQGGESLEYLRLQEGEFVVDPSRNRELEISSFSYEVDLRPRADSRSAAHASWVNKDSGVLFFDDILPARFLKRAAINLELPDGWTAATTLATVQGNMWLREVSEATALIGPKVRQLTKNGTTIATGDSWQFSDEKAITAANEIVEAYRKVFGSDPSTKRLILLVRFPLQDVPKGTWEAETRGNTVILASSDMPFESQAIQRLSEQLRHELFHLWIPNGVKLTGNYDWFYEGFAMYQSLKTGVALNQITFADLLDTLSRAYAIDRASSAGRLSLIEASAARFAGNETQVYSRGMITAFLCDLTLLRESNGKRSVETLLRQLFARPHDAKPEDGNTAVLRVLDSFTELGPIVKGYVRGNSPVNWATFITGAGLEMDTTAVIRLRVAQRLTGQQKTMLDKLGYNSWRKLTKK